MGQSIGPTKRPSGPSSPAVKARSLAARTRSTASSSLAWSRKDCSRLPRLRRETLIRRVTLDLTGLPADSGRNRCLSSRRLRPGVRELWSIGCSNSPHYGERMAWDWLDAARYADTNGYQGDPTRSMWYWRDWVIDALNSNMPFDRFTIEQLAGDLLPNPTRSQLIATGFHRNHMINGEGGRIAEESRVDYVQDRVETTGTVWMGLTFNCCRCHDHKFDPFTQREYYQLSAYFNSIDESGGTDAYPQAQPGAAHADPRAGTAHCRFESPRSSGQSSSGPSWSRSCARLSPNGKRRLPKPAANRPTAEWTPLVPEEMTSEAGAMLATASDDAILVSGPNPAQDSFSMTVPIKRRDDHRLSTRSLARPVVRQFRTGPRRQRQFRPHGIQSRRSTASRSP